MTNGCPVMYEESSEVRKSASAATSSGRPIRPSGTSFLYSAPTASAVSSGSASGSSAAGLVIGVSTAPGHMALTRIPFAASSTAATLVSPSTACLVAAYAPTNAMPVSPVYEEVLTMVPPPAASISGATFLMPRKAPTWLTCTTCWNSSSGVVTSSLKRRMPALLTSPSIFPKAPFAAATAACQSASWLTSRCTNSAVSSPSSFARASPCASSTSAITTRAPSAANSRASCSPCPRAAPLISTTRPSSLPMA